MDVDYPTEGSDLPYPLPYSRHEPWSLAPWLTGLIVALVIFVILIPALCSACYHYYSYKVSYHKKVGAFYYPDSIILSLPSVFSHAVRITIVIEAQIPPFSLA